MAQVKKKKKKQTEAQRLAHRDAVIAHADNKFVAELTIQETKNIVPQQNKFLKVR